MSTNYKDSQLDIFNEAEKEIRSKSQEKIERLKASIQSIKNSSQETYDSGLSDVEDRNELRELNSELTDEEKILKETLQEKLGSLYK
ncbi:MAG: hypothetical protein MJ156_02160 [Alphaproteobacteria bacterium]|nr:hypothetical protein [Alphaproteobacteria bacterium]